MLKYSKRFIAKEVEYFYSDVIEKNEAERWNLVTSKKERKENRTERTFSREIKNGQFSLLFQDYLIEMDKEISESFNPNNILDHLSTFNSKY